MLLLLALSRYWGSIYASPTTMGQEEAATEAKIDEAALDAVLAHVFPWLNDADRAALVLDYPGGAKGGHPHPQGSLHNGQGQAARRLLQGHQVRCAPQAPPGCLQ